MTYNNEQQAYYFEATAFINNVNYTRRTFKIEFLDEQASNNVSVRLYDVSSDETLLSVSEIRSTSAYVFNTMDSDVALEMHNNSGRELDFFTVENGAYDNVQDGQTHMDQFPYGGITIREVVQ